MKREEKQEKNESRKREVTLSDRKCMPEPQMQP